MRTEEIQPGEQEFDPPEPSPLFKALHPTQWAVGIVSGDGVPGEWYWCYGCTRRTRARRIVLAGTHLGVSAALICCGMPCATRVAEGLRTAMEEEGGVPDGGPGRPALSPVKGPQGAPEGPDA